MTTITTENPYNFGKPVKTFSQLGGRDVEMEDIKASLLSKQMSLAIIGKRGIGKTSIMNATFEICNEIKFIPVKISLDSNLLKDDYSFFRELYTELISALKERGRVDETDYANFMKIFDEFDLEDISNYFLKFPKSYVSHVKSNTGIIPRHYIEEDLKTLQNKAQTQIVILLDECDLLVQNRGLLELLRNFLQSVDGYSLVLCGTNDFLLELNKVFESAAREIKKISIEGFKNERQTIDLIYKCLSKEDQDRLTFNKETFRDLHKIAEGNPYELKLVCHYLWQKAKITNKKIVFKLTPDLFSSVANQMETAAPAHSQFISNIQGINLEDLINIVKLVSNEALTIPEKALLTELFETTYSKGQVETTEEKFRVKALLYNDILEINSNDKVSFKGEAFEKVYLKYLAQSKLKDRKDHWGNLSFPLAIFEKFIHNAATLMSPQNRPVSAVFYELNDQKNDVKEFFEDNFEKSYNYFSTEKTKLTGFSASEMYDMEQFLATYIQFEGKPIFHFLITQLKYKEKVFRGCLVLENQLDLQSLQEFNSKYKEQFDDIGLSLTDVIEPMPELDPNCIYEKLVKLKSVDQKSGEILEERLSHVAINLATVDKLYSISKKVFEKLREIKGFNFELNNNIGFISINLSLDDALKEFLNNEKFLDKRTASDVFIYNYNLASLCVYQKNYEDARKYLREIYKIKYPLKNQQKKKEGEEQKSESRYLYTFFIGDNTNIKNIEVFDNEDGVETPQVLISAYIDYVENPESHMKVENDLKSHYDEHKNNPIYLKGLYSFYKTIEDDERYKKYKKEYETALD